MMKKMIAAAALAASLALPQTANAAELVTNGGFETGSFSGWTQAGNTGATFVASSPVNSGNFAAALGPVGSTGSLTQILNTVIGTNYTLSFALRTSNGTPNSFRAFFDGTEVFNFTNIVGLPYTTYSFSNLTASSANSSLSFVFQQDPSYFYLDDVSVQGLTAAVPEPGTWMLMLLGFGAIGFAMRRRQKTRVRFQFA
jgi:hypothetical protein